jgi:hypothetical protein
MSKLTASIYAAVVIVAASLAAVSAFLAAAAGLGYATHRIFPAVDVGAGAITAAVALGTMVLVFFHPNKRPAISIPQEILDQIAEEGEMDLDGDDDEGIEAREGDPGFIRRIEFESTPKRSRRRRRS